MRRPTRWLSRTSGRCRASALTAVVLLAGAGPVPATPAPPRAPAPQVLVALDDATPPPTAAGLRAALDPLLGVPQLGRAVGATVVDGQTGQVLYDRGGTAPRVPASVAKLATGAAALQLLGPDTTLRTRVVRGRAGVLVLVGGGDATLTGLRPAGGYPRWASLVDLADATARALADEAAPVTLLVDDSLFVGPAVSPDWKPGYVANGEVAPVTALMADHGLARPGTSDERRARDPAITAGERFAALLRERGVPVAGRVRRTPAGAGTRPLAEVASPPVAVLVEHMLRASDNDVAESLARLAGAASGRGGSFAGGADAVSAATAASGAAPGVRLRDGSGLARGSRMTSTAAALLLADAAEPEPDRPLEALLSGLPVGGFSGTLAERYRRGPTRAAAGTVRAKTGSLDGVTTLAGQAVDAQGRLLAFAVLADRVPNGVEARAALDRVAAAVAACGCR